MPRLRAALADEDDGDAVVVLEALRVALAVEEDGPGAQAMS